MNMTRRSFIKGLLALSATPLILKLPDWEETPVAEESSLARLYLDDQEFALNDFYIEQYGWHSEDNKEYEKSRWSSECRIEGDRTNELKELASQHSVKMKIVPSGLSFVFEGDVRICSLAFFATKNNISSSILVFGDGALNVLYA